MPLKFFFFWQLEKEQERLKRKGKKKPGQNGQIGNGIRDPLDPMDVAETDETPGNNFTYRERTKYVQQHCYCFS